MLIKQDQGGRKIVVIGYIYLKQNGAWVICHLKVNYDQQGFARKLSHFIFTDFRAEFECRENIYPDTGGGD